MRIEEIKRAQSVLRKAMTDKTVIAQNALLTHCQDIKLTVCLSHIDYMYSNPKTHCINANLWVSSVNNYVPIDTFNINIIVNIDMGIVHITKQTIDSLVNGEYATVLQIPEQLFK